MRTLGLIGGMSWESTQTYYRLLNEAVKARLGGLHSASLILHSVDFETIAAMQREDRWADAAQTLVGIAQGLSRVGAEGLLICTNTMHKVADEVAAAIDIPLLHIADATADAIRQRDVHKVGLLGTAFTMEQPFYRERLEHSHGLGVVVPGPAQRQAVHRVIFDELCQGRINPESRALFLQIIEGLQAQGAEAVILGCTEIALLVSQDDTALPLFDTTYWHVQAAVDWALTAD